MSALVLPLPGKGTCPPHWGNVIRRVRSHRGEESLIWYEEDRSWYQPYQRIIPNCFKSETISGFWRICR